MPENTCHFYGGFLKSFRQNLSPLPIRGRSRRMKIVKKERIWFAQILSLIFFFLKDNFVFVGKSKLTFRYILNILRGLHVFLKIIQL